MITSRVYLMKRSTPLSPPHGGNEDAEEIRMVCYRMGRNTLVAGV